MLPPSQWAKRKFKDTPADSKQRPLSVQVAEICAFGAEGLGSTGVPSLHLFANMKAEEAWKSFKAKVQKRSRTYNTSKGKGKVKGTAPDLTASLE